MLRKRQQPEPSVEDEDAVWLKLGKALSAYKRAKKDCRMAEAEVHKVAKELPVRLDVKLLIEQESEAEN